jgi:hypothetical protein
VESICRKISGKLARSATCGPTWSAG